MNMFNMNAVHVRLRAFKIGMSPGDTWGKPNGRIARIFFWVGEITREITREKFRQLSESKHAQKNLLENYLGMVQGHIAGENHVNR